MKKQLIVVLSCFLFCLLTTTTAYGQTKKVTRSRTCSVCKQSKPISDFSGDSKTCKSCVKKAEERRQAEMARQAREKAEKERIAEEQAEKERIIREKEQKRQQEEAERKAREKAEKERIARDQKQKAHILKMNALGADYYLGRNGKEKNISEAMKYFQETSKLGDITGKINLACCYFLSYNFSEDSSRNAWDEVYRLAEKGNATALNNYAVYMEKTNQYAFDLSHFKEVLALLMEAAMKDDVYAIFNIGEYLFHRSDATTVISKTRYFDENSMLKKAREWYQKAANKGFPPGQKKLSEMLEYGWGGKKDKKQATYWKEKAKTQNRSYLEVSPFHLFMY